MASQEANVLLRHPDYRERMMALKLDSVTPEDVAYGALDPHPEVFKAAFYHPDSAHALDILAASSRDAAGNPIHDRHDLLLKDPRCTQDHIDSMHRAVSNDGYLPIQDQANRLNVFKGRTSFAKRENVIRLNHHSDPREQVVKRSMEEPKHQELHDIYNKAVNTTSPIQPQDADLHDVGIGSPKVVYKVPHEDINHKFLVKPYHEEELPHSGWNESTSQELYHAAEIPHLHQKSFVSTYNNGPEKIPATVIHMEQSKPIHTIPKQEIIKNNPNAVEDARKIAIMDFLENNGDRHTNNLQVRPNGQLLAIDHAQAFSYPGRALPNDDGSVSLEGYDPSKKTNNHLNRFTRKAPSILTHSSLADEPVSMEANNLDYHNTLKNWWPRVSTDVKRAFQKRLEMIGDPAVKRHLEAGFNAKHKWLDEAAKKEPIDFLESLKKHVEDPYAEYNKDFPIIEKQPDTSKKYNNVHNDLLTSHPKHIQNQVDTFEKYVNHPSNPIHPEKGDLSGVEAKSLVKHADNKYLLKAANTTWNPLSGWSEMTSQAMYHAGNLGHLHQHVHATHLNIKEGDRTRKQAVVAIHFKPGKWKTLSELRNTDPIKAKDFYNKHLGDLRKGYLMDFLTGNNDRHDENILVGPKNQPQFIDQAFAFRRDNFDNPEEQKKTDVKKEFGKLTPFNWQNFSNDHSLGTLADEGTHAWWREHKKPIVAAFYKHLDMIPDKEERSRRKAYFNHRVDAIDNRHPIVFDHFDMDGLHKDELGLRNNYKSLRKALGNASYLHDQHNAFPTQQGLKVDTKGVHEQLMKAHPAAINPGVRHFELAINGSKNPIKPMKEQSSLKGLQPKALYGHNNKAYLTKTAHENSTALGAWNELTSQAMYHAGNIGHLHQKVHATIGKTGLNRSEPAHAIVIHMEPNTMTYWDAKGYTNDKKQVFPPQDHKRAYQMMANPEHRQSLKKIGIMDYLTANHDRHGNNIILAPDGSPIAIDHGRSFFDDRKHAFGEEDQNELQHTPEITSDPYYQNKYTRTWEDHQGDSKAADLGGDIDEDTWDWWHANKEPMLDAYKKHLNMIPDQEARQKMLNSFTVRYNRLNNEFSQNKHVHPEGVGGVSGHEVTDLNQEHTDLT